MIGCNRVWIQEEEISSEEKFEVTLSDDSTPAKKYALDVSALFPHSDVAHHGEEIVKELHDLNRNIEKAFGSQHIGPGHSSFRDELNHIASELAKKK